MLTISRTVRRFQRSVLGVALAGAPVLGMTAQEPETIDGRRLCPSCAIRLVRVATLGTADGPGQLGVQPTINAAANGRFYVADFIEPGKVLVYDSVGRYVHAFGRSGQGPGEYSRPLHVLLNRAGDAITIIDAIQQRATTLRTTDYSVVSVTALPLSIGRYIIMPNGSLVVNGGLQTRQAFGLPLHVVDVSWRVLRSFGSDDPTVLPGQRWRQVRALAPAGGGLFWAAPPNRLVVELWGQDGVRRRSLTRQVAWFPEWLESGGIPRLAPPRPRLVALHQDAVARLWVLIQLADANWKRGDPSLEERRLEFPAEAQYFDTIVEVWDVTAKRLIASQRFDQQIHPFIGRGFAFTAREDAAGVPYYDVWRLELIDTTTGR